MCCTETQPKSPNSKQRRCRSTVARKNSLERQEARKKLREEPGSEGLSVLFWLCRVEIITVHGQDVQMFIVMITVVVEGATGQHLGVHVSWLFIAVHSELETAGAVERERV